MISRLNKERVLLAAVLGGASLLMAPAFAQDSAKKNDAWQNAAQEDSSQPASDTWITTKVKAELLADTEVSGTAIKVETVNGVVTLSGEVDSQAQIDKAKALARGIKGVTNVDASMLSVAGTTR